MSDTPLTDAMAFEADAMFPDDVKSSQTTDCIFSVVPVEFAQKLERALRELRNGFDPNPTVEWHDEESLARAFIAYMKRINENIQGRIDVALTQDE